MIYGLLFAVWRRIYGEGSVKGLLGNRAFQSFLSIVMLMTIYVTNVGAWQCWLAALAVSLWLTFQFWSRAIGEILDCGESTIQTADSYNRWFRIPLDLIYNKLGLPLYVGSYDWWYCTARFTLCLLPMCYFSWWYLVPGLSAAPIYWGCKWLYKKFPKLYTIGSVWLDDSKNLAEILHGFVFGLTVGLTGWGL